MPGRHSALLRGAWVSRAPLGILVPGHGHRWNAAVVSIAMVESMCYSFFFARCPGFPLRGCRWLFLGPGSS